MALTKEAKVWCGLYVACSVLGNLGHGSVTTVIGPTQVYLARNVDVDIDTINLVWTIGFASYFVGAAFVGLVFRRRCVSALSKVTFVGSMLAANGALMCALPFATDFVLFSAIRVAQYFALGAYITADSSMIVYTMGPVVSRPWTSAIHAAVGSGFMLGSFLVTPFLPDSSDADSDQSKEAVCQGGERGGNGEGGGMQYEAEYLGGISKISWPFLISGGWCVVAFFFYLGLGLLPIKMPRHYQDDDGGDRQSAGPRIHRWRLVVFLVLIYYMMSCGVERIFQSMAYTYGLCGPLDLTPAAAVATDWAYNGGFFVGRLVSIVVAKLIRPRNMILSSVSMCAVAAAVLCAFGGTDARGLYAGAALCGFFVSWEFSAGYSWMAQKMDITGGLAPVFFVGCGIGGSVFPPLAGFVFTSGVADGRGVLYLTLAACAAQCAVFACMWAAARKRSRRVYEFDRGGALNRLGLEDEEEERARFTVQESHL